MNKPLKITGLTILAISFAPLTIALAIGWVGFALYEWGKEK